MSIYINMIQDAQFPMCNFKNPALIEWLTKADNSVNKCSKLCVATEPLHKGNPFQNVKRQWLAMGQMEIIYRHWEV